MSDQDIIKKLIDKDNRFTQEFFFKHCKPLFLSIINSVFDYSVDYDEIVNELYLHLMENDARRLRTFNFNSSLYGWLKMVAIHFFMDKKNHDKVIDINGSIPPSEKEIPSMSHNAMEAKWDIEKLLQAMPNERYAYIIRRLILEDMAPEDLASEMQITVANLYNIKKRAIQQMTMLVIDDIKRIEKQG